MAVTPVSPTAGQLIDKAFWDAQVYQQFVDLYSSWTSYTVTWTGATTNPTLGNGTLDGAYKAIGKTIAVRIRLVYGSTSSAGSGLWAFSLPVGFAPAAVQSLAGFVSNQAGSARYALGAYLTAGSGVFRIAAIDGTSGVSNNSPIVWANGDQLVLTGTYEAS
ncbi:hypothetical protein ACWEU6_21865 [Streptosporangium sandarakinum]